MGVVRPPPDWLAEPIPKGQKKKKLVFGPWGGRATLILLIGGGRVTHKLALSHPLGQNGSGRQPPLAKIPIFLFLDFLVF
jgi:hypothetical protein